MFSQINLSKIKDFLKDPRFKELSSKTLCLFDVDGVFFPGFLDPTTWVSNMNKTHLQLLEKILKTGSGIWIFTDRGLFGSWGDYLERLKQTTEAKVYESSQDFLKAKKTPKHAIILRAGKPGEDSQEVVQRGLKHFSKTYYFAAQDWPLQYDDKEMLEAILKENPKIKDKLLFFNIC